MRSANGSSHAVHHDSVFHVSLLKVVKLLPRLCQLNEQWRRPKPLSKTFERLQPVHNLSRPNRIRPEQETSLKGREPEAVNQPQIHIAYVAHNLVFNRPRRL